MSAGYYNHAFKTIERLALDIEYELSVDFKEALYFYRDSEQIKEGLDTEDDDEIGVGCAGGIDVTAVGTYNEEETPEIKMGYSILKILNILI